MNRTTRTIVLTALTTPLAAMAVLAAPAAHADGPGSGFSAAQPGVQPMELDLTAEDPGPGPDPMPQPGLDEIAQPEGPSDPEGPDDEQAPEEEPDDPGNPAEGIDDLTGPTPCPTHGVDCGGSDDGDDDSSDGGSDGEGGDEVRTPYGDDGLVVEVPTRVDAGLGGQLSAADGSGSGLELAWLAAGGVMVTASGAAFAARNRRRSGVSA